VFSDTETEQEWLAMTKQNQAMCNFPHLFGVIDEKHVVLQCATNSASEHVSSKSTCSIVSFGLVDANYNFMFVDAGCQRRIPDSGVVTIVELCKTRNKNLTSSSAGLPKRERKRVPCFFIGDEAIPLRENLLRVFPEQYPKGSKEQILNFRICRARSVVENLFLLASSIF
jgi:hypothetical protein